MRRWILLALLAVGLAGLTVTNIEGQEVSAQARRLHQRAIVVDTHVDVPASHARDADYNVGERHSTGHVDLPRMKDGGLDAAFFSIYMPATVTGPEAVKRSLELIDWTKQQVARNSSTAILAASVADIRRAHKQGKLAILMGMEGGHMIDDSLSTLRMYAELGVRYLTLTHGRKTNWAGSSGDPEITGLTDFGREVVRELNRSGVMVDLSHVSDQTFFDALEVAQAPVVLSHSSARAICDHPRNITDEMMRAVAKNGGVIQITFVNSFIDPALRSADQAISPERDAKLAELEKLYADDPSKRREEARRIRNEYQAGLPKASWERIIDHIDHAVKTAGIDHVGLGSDFDGATMPEGMDDVTRLPRITEALLAKGYSDKDIEKILGGNLLRVLERVERIGSQLRAAKGPVK